MKCPKCDSELPDKAKFCLECGSNISALSGQSGVDGDVSLGVLNTAAASAAQSVGGLRTIAAGQSSHASREVSQGAAEALSERYEFVEELGRGGFAVVWKAVDKKLGRTVAIKKLHNNSDRTAAARFKREAQAIAALNHRNIVAVYDVGEENGETYLVMEYVEGGSLSECLKKKGKFSLDEALPLFRGIAQGISYAHRKNLVHRDIKPANILLQSEEGELVPKIVDFGLAQSGRDSELSMSGYGMGTPYYMPPEQRRDAKSVNHTADIYALGKVLCQM